MPDILQKWDGLVLHVEDGLFYACLTSIFGDAPDMIVNVPITEVHGDDRCFVKPGAGFYWSVTADDSILRFRRLPPVTPLEWEYACTKARALLEPAYA